MRSFISKGENSVILEPTYLHRQGRRGGTDNKRVFFLCHFRMKRIWSWMRSYQRNLKLCAWWFKPASTGESALQGRAQESGREKGALPMALFVKVFHISDALTTLKLRPLVRMGQVHRFSRSKPLVTEVSIKSIALILIHTDHVPSAVSLIYSSRDLNERKNEKSTDKIPPVDWNYFILI